MLLYAKVQLLCIHHDSMTLQIMYLVVQEELRQEHGERVSAQALVEQHKQQLADLKLEASVLRQASAEHARSHPLPCHLTLCT